MDPITLLVVSFSKFLEYYLYILFFSASLFAACGDEDYKQQEEADHTSKTIPIINKENTEVRGTATRELTEADFFDFNCKNEKMNCKTKEDWIKKFEKMKTETDAKNPNDTKIKQRQIANILNILKDNTKMNQELYTKQETGIHSAKDSINERYKDTRSVIDELLKCFIYKPDSATAQAPTTASPQESPISAPEVGVHSPNPDEPSTPYLTYLLYALGIALFAFLFYKWQVAEDRAKKLREKLDREKQNDTQKTTQTINTVYPPLNEEEPKNKTLPIEKPETNSERKRREAADKDDERKQREKQQREAHQAEQDRKREADCLAALPPPIIRTLYFTTPNREGYFSANYASDYYIETESMYKLELTSSNQGNLSFISDPSTMHNALNHRELCLLPVCTEQNARDTRATKIETITKGIAHLEGDRWILRSNERIMIKYVV